MGMINFALPPTIGTVLLLDEQEYELAAIEPHTRRDGLPTVILHWRSTCPACGQEFTVTSGLRSTGIARRCLEHRMAARPVHGKRGRKVQVQVALA